MPETPNEFDLKKESVIVRNKRTGHEVRVPAFPEACDYVRVVRHLPDGSVIECAYWNEDEWADDPADVVGAIMGATKQVFDGTWEEE